MILLHSCFDIFCLQNYEYFLIQQKFESIREFANCFVSVVCALNGRKVMTWIMKKAKRTMI